MNVNFWVTFFEWPPTTDILVECHPALYLACILAQILTFHLTSNLSTNMVVLWRIVWRSIWQIFFHLTYILTFSLLYITLSLACIYENKSIHMYSNYGTPCGIFPLAGFLTSYLVKVLTSYLTCYLAAYWHFTGHSVWHCTQRPLQNFALESQGTFKIHWSAESLQHPIAATETDR